MVIIMEVAKITSKGQITIPISIRRKLDIHEGDKVLFIYKPDGVLMVNPATFQGPSAGDIVDVAETEMAAEAVAAAKKRENAKAAPSAAEAVEKAVVAETVVEETAANEPVREKAVSRPVPPPVEEPERPAAQIGGLNLGSLLDDIRSIGSNI